MKLILTFEHEHHSKDISSEVICIEGPSVEAVSKTLKALIESTTTERFYFCGQDFYVRDFRQEVSYQRIAHAEVLAEHLNKRMPHFFEVQGQPYIFKKFTVQTVDAWFNTRAHTFGERSQLATA
jgi:ABC-type iron transport system FetAB ATPase subunit